MASLQDLAHYRDKSRLLLVFAPSPGDLHYLEQKRLLEAAGADLRERDMLVFYPSAEETAIGGGLEPQVTEALRQHLGISDDAFTVILIGKDGGEKARFSEATPPDRLFRIIDRMPMRRREMKEGL